MTEQRQPGGFAVPDAMYEDFLRTITAPGPFERTERPPLARLTRRQRLRAIPRRARLALGELLMDAGARLSGYDPRGRDRWGDR